MSPAGEGKHDKPMPFNNFLDYTATYLHHQVIVIVFVVRIPEIKRFWIVEWLRSGYFHCILNNKSAFKRLRHIILSNSSLNNKMRAT